MREAPLYLLHLEEPRVLASEVDLTDLKGIC